MTIRNFIAALNDLVDDPSNDVDLNSDILVSLDEEGIRDIIEIGIGHFQITTAALIEIDM